MENTLTRGRLADHPIWARALGGAELTSRLILPVVVSGSVADREPVEGVTGLERLSLTELVREARQASVEGMAGLLIFGSVDRKDETAMIAGERDHIVQRAIAAVKQAVPDLAVATDVCVCAYTAHGQCVLFGRDGADVSATIERLCEIALTHADAGADLVIPSGMLDGTVQAVVAAFAGASHDDVPVAAMAKLESVLYATHRRLVGAVPVRERAVQLLAADDPNAARLRALRDIAAGADAVVVKPGAAALDVVTAIAGATDRPVLSFYTADEHALVAAAPDAIADARQVERELVAASRRAGADLVITYGAWSVAEAA